MGPYIHDEDATGVQSVHCPLRGYAYGRHEKFDLFFDNDVN